MTGWAVPGFVRVRQVRADAVGRRFVARHRMTRRVVSITYLSEEFLTDREFRTRFRAESARLAEVRDARVVRLRQYVEGGDGVAVLADHVNGSPLRALLLEEGAMSADAAVVVFRDTLRGLAASHARGVAHGDLKPEGVLLTRTGRVRLIDFGLFLRDARRMLAWSTPFYLAPEQWRGGPATPAGDLYAATAVFFECLLGAPPFHADSSSVLGALHEHGAAPLEAVPGLLRHLVALGLAKDPANRPSARRLLIHLEDAARHGLGTGWERRGRRELTRLLTAPSPLPHLSAAAGSSDSTGRMLRQPVGLAAALGSALVVATGLSSPSLPPVPDSRGPAGGTDLPADPPVQGMPVRLDPRSSPGEGSGADEPVSGSQSGPMVEPTGSAIASAAQRETMANSASGSSSEPHQLALTPEKVPPEASTTHAPASPTPTTTSAEPTAVAQTMSAPPTHPKPPSESEEDPDPGTSPTPEEPAPWTTEDPFGEEWSWLPPSTPEWPTGYEEDEGCLPEDAHW
ncbi:MAG: protein kinase domain-containing protein [Pseudonocardiaceae bacterium]